MLDQGKKKTTIGSDRRNQSTFFSQNSRGLKNHNTGKEKRRK
jgi:hypothetical protein